MSDNCITNIWIEIYYKILCVSVCVRVHMQVTLS